MQCSDVGIKSRCLDEAWGAANSHLFGISRKFSLERQRAESLNRLGRFFGAVSMEISQIIGTVIGFHLFDGQSSTLKIISAHFEVISGARFGSENFLFV